MIPFRHPVAAMLLTCGALAAADQADAVLASWEGPLSTASFTVIDTEPRFACDGDITTVWSPKGGQAALRIDLGRSEAVSGWRLAATIEGDLSWDGPSPSKPSPGYEVLASEDGTAWRSLVKPAKGAGRIRSGERVANTLPEAVRTRWLEIRLGNLRGLMDCEILGTDGAVLPSFARARACAGLRTRLRGLGWQARYAAKAEDWVREHGSAGPAPAAGLDEEVGALDRTLAAATQADDAQVARWQAQVAGLDGRIAARVALADAWCDLLLRPELAETATARIAAMGADAGPAAVAAAAMVAMAGDQEPSRQPEFDRHLADLDTAWQAWSASHRARVVRDGRWWVRADGRRIVPFGLNYVQIGSIPSLANPTLIRRSVPGMNEPSPRDFRNLRLWGFNTARLCIRPSSIAIDMRTGEAADPAYLAKIGEILGWARRYDIHVVIDLHLEYDLPAMAPRDGAAWTQNHCAMLPYYIGLWRTLAGICRDQPHVLAYELVGNEPNFRGLRKALQERYTDPWHDTASVIDAWHAYLAGRHGSLEAAARFWGQTTRNPQENGLLRDDSREAVLDAVALARRFPAIEPEANTRVRDYLLAAQAIYRQQFSAMAAAIRTVDPDHLLAFSVNYDLSNLDEKKDQVKTFGTDCRLLFDQLPAEATGITDHYFSREMASRFPATGQPWFAGENWIYDNQTADFAGILAAGGGNIGWAYWPADRDFQGAIGADLWLKDQWKSWTRSAWFSDHLRHGDIPRAEVAVVMPLLAPEQSVRRLPRLLGRMDVRFDVLIDETVARDPAILGRYRAVVADLDRASVPAIRAVLASPVPALLVNRQLIDGDNRWGDGSAAALAGTFYHPDRLPAPPPAAADPLPISLAGTWWFRTDPQLAGDAAGWHAASDFAGWDQLPAPGYWESEAVSRGRYSTYDGLAWYAREIPVPEAFRGRDLMFNAVIDDMDTAWFNGVQIGTTDHGTPNWWAAPRRYRIPAALIRHDRPNLLVIRVTDEKNRGGIAPGILQLGLWDRDDRHLTWTARLGDIAAGTTQEIAMAREMPRVGDADLAPGCAVLARFADGLVAVARAGRHLLWLGGDGVTFGGDREHPATEESLLAAHLREAGVAMTWPVTPASNQLDVTRLAGFILVENRTDQPYRLDPATLAGGQPIAWVRLVAPPYRLREPTGPVEIPAGAYAGVVLGEVPTK